MKDICPSAGMDGSQPYEYYSRSSVMSCMMDWVINGREMRMNHDPKAGEPGKYLLRKQHVIAFERWWDICHAESTLGKGSGVRK